MLGTKRGEKGNGSLVANRIGVHLGVGLSPTASTRNSRAKRSFGFYLAPWWLVGIVLGKVEGQVKLATLIGRIWWTRDIGSPVVHVIVDG